MISGIVTIIAMLAFGVVVWWAYGRSRKSMFEELGRIPLDDEPQCEERQP